MGSAGLALVVLGVVSVTMTAAENASAPAQPAESVQGGGRAVFNLSVLLDEGEVKAPGVPPRSVIADGIAVGHWEACKADFYNSDDCFVESEYTSQIEFEFEFENDEDLKGVRQPSVSASGGYARPVVQDFRVDKEQRAGEFIVLYQCAPEQTSKTPSDSTMTLTFPVGNAQNHTVHWGKTCSSGENDKVSLKYVPEDASTKDAAAFPTSKSTSDDAWVVSPLSTSSTLVVELAEPGRYQGFEAPQIHVGNSVLNASFRGAQHGAVLYRGSFEFNVNYECYGNGHSDVSVTIPIPPWDPLKGSWVKDCGGGKAVGLTIGTKSGASDIVAGGEVQGAFAIDIDMLEKAKNLYTIPVDQKSVSFVFVNQNRPGAKHVSMGPVSITADQHVLFTKIVAPIWDRSALSARGAGFNVGDSRHLDLYFICKKSGPTNVLVTLPFVRYQNVEFAFTKMCRKPKRVQAHSLYTANGFGVLLGLLAASVGVASCYIYRRKRASYDLIVPS